MRDDFFHQEECDRCGGELKPYRKMSWFTEETLCPKCCDKENQLRMSLRKQGKDEKEYEGCGYVPGNDN